MVRPTDCIHFASTNAGFAPLGTKSAELFSTALTYGRHDDSEKRQGHKDKQDGGWQLVAQCSRASSESRVRQLSKIDTIFA